MNKTETIQLVNALPDDIDIVSLTVSMGSGDQPQEPPEDDKPFTRLVEIEDGESFKEIDHKNEKGFPVMKSAETGWHTNVGERFEVEVDFIAGDSGYRWLRIWQGPAGGDNEIEARGYYINKAKTGFV